jgi:taurine dioxygenase
MTAHNDKRDSDMALSIEATGGTFVARIEGIDLSAAVGDETWGELKQAWLDHRIIHLPDQHLDEAQLLAFSRNLGPLEPHVLSDYHHPVHPEILMLSTVVEAGAPKGLADAGSYWHSDVSYKAEPSRASALYGIEIPEHGGDTLFCDTQAAYDALPTATKSRIADLTAVHSYEYRTNIQVNELGIRKPLTAEQKRQTPDVVHPVVRTQPETGRKAIFVNPGFTVRILGLTEADSRALLDELFAHCLQDRFRYDHAWRVGDLVAWDNAVTMHSATVRELPVGARRTMWRTVISGDVPF